MLFLFIYLSEILVFHAVYIALKKKTQQLNVKLLQPSKLTVLYLRTHAGVQLN